MLVKSQIARCYTRCFISLCHFMTTYISVTVELIKIKLFTLTSDSKFTQQKFGLNNQRNKRFTELFTCVQLASPCLLGTLFREHKYPSSLNSACHFCMAHRSGGCVENSHSTHFYQIPKHKTQNTFSFSVKSILTK